MLGQVKAYPGLTRSLQENRNKCKKKNVDSDPKRMRQKVQEVKWNRTFTKLVGLCNMAAATTSIDQILAAKIDFSETFTFLSHTHTLRVTFLRS